MTGMGSTSQVVRDTEMKEGVCVCVCVGEKQTKRHREKESEAKCLHDAC